MPIENFKITNNAITTLLSSITSGSNILFLNGREDLFPTSNFIISITKKDITNPLIVTRRENIHISARSGNQCNVGTRAYELVPISDTATTQTQTALPFDAGDTIELVWSSKMYDELKLLDANKVEKTGDTMTGPLTTSGLKYTKAINIPTGTDLNTIREAGFYDGENLTNAPVTGSGYITVEAYSNANTWCHQTFTTFGSGNTGNQIYSRTLIANVWGIWEKLIVGGVPKLSSIANISGIAPKLPNAYSQELTPELASNIGGNAGDLNIPGCASPWVDLITYAGPINITYGAGFATQKAIGKSNGEEFKRISASATTWGNWMRIDGEIRPGTTYTYASANTERTTTSTSYVLMKSIVVNKTGSYLVRYDIKSLGGTLAYGILRIGGKDVSLENNSSSSYITYSQIVHISAGQVLGFFGRHGGSGDICHVRNFQILYDVGEGITPVGTIID